MKLKFKYKTPDELPIYKFLEFKDITEDDSLYDFQKELGALAILCDVSEDDIYKLTPQEAQAYIQEMHDNIAKNKTPYTILKNDNFQYDHPSKRPKKLELNGHKYYVHYKLNKMNVAQYVDFQMHAAKNKDQFDGLLDILSVFVIPEGHKYGENYDMNVVNEDLKSLRVDVALAINFFLKKRSVTLMRNKIFYIRTMMKMTMWKIKDEALKEQIRETIQQMKEMEQELKNL